MKFSTLCSASLLAVTAFAFPASMLNNKDISAEQLAQISEMVEKIKREVGEKRQLGAGIIKPGFDANAQRISTSGEHRYVCALFDLDRAELFRLLTCRCRLPQAPTTFADPAQV